MDIPWGYLGFHWESLGVLDASSGGPSGILGRSWGELGDRPGGTEKTEDSPSESDLGEPLGCFWWTQVGLWSAEGGTNVDISCLLLDVLAE